MVWDHPAGVWIHPQLLLVMPVQESDSSKPASGVEVK